MGWGRSDETPSTVAQEDLERSSLSSESVTFGYLERTTRPTQTSIRKYFFAYQNKDRYDHRINREAYFGYTLLVTSSIFSSM